MQYSKGHTLIELLLYVAVAGTVLLLATLFVNTLLEARVRGSVIAEVNAQGAHVLETVLQTVRNAEGVTTPLPGANGATLMLDVVAGVDDPTTFSLNGTVLEISEGGGSGVALTNDRIVVSDLHVENLSPTGEHDAVSVRFTVTHVNPEGRYEYTYTQTFEGGAVVRTP